MATTNFLSVKTHLSDFKSNADKDAMSEVSESGTSNSVASAEDVQKLAVILGISNIEDVYQEKFRVDRRRLEGMLADNLEESQTAQAFFHRIMSETNTLINWPARLKIGARSKKDPHVRIAGRADDVKRAREKIMQVLDTRSNRVTMKIDVSYTDHSHIIGKGGLTIKRVMEDTGCHIHFPDSNRTSATEKSNQVSIAGDMERVERARARVRALTPLVFSFELPIAGAAQPLPDVTSPYVQQLQEQYNVQVMVRNRSKLHANMMVVKGVQWEVQATMEATGLLMNYMCGPLASQTQVHMSLEISPAHHGAVVGRGAEQLKLIMRGTGTQIMFPDAADPNIPALRKSCVTITGHMKDVYAARQQLVGSLPLVVIFDMPAEGGARLDEEAVGQLMQKHNVFISVRHKPKQGIASVIIKGIERCASSKFALPPWLVSPQHRAQLHLPPVQSVQSVQSVQHNNSPHLYKNSPNSWNSMCAGADMSGMQQQMLQPYHQMPDARPITLNQLLNCSSQASSGYQSNFTGSSVSLDVNNTSGGEASNVASPSVSPISAHSPAPSATSATSAPSNSADNDRNHNELASLISGMPLSARRAVGCEKKTLQTLARLSPLMDYQAKRAEAEKAMRESVGGGYRVPTGHWAGNYFSKTSPGLLTNNANGENNTTPEKGWNRSELVRPNIAEMMTPPKSAQPAAPREPSPQPAPAKQCRYQQLYDLLRDIGLYKYIDLFKKHELDMSTFASLNEADLVEIGVTAFGARRKMLLTIAELQKQAATFKGGATPGGGGGGGSGERALVHSPQYDLQPLQDKW
ncbi:Protein bicaudal C [Papilio machaon]|uniref:Protein bicaudal C n=1 Tax=Papilio machaon TaxID=76193 RepID=A0A194R4Y5_PAPMA|nr:Protein bicaudal C [Papilio machaon]